MVSMLLVALLAGFGVSVVACALALWLFPWFRSGERKPGDFRPDQSTGGVKAVVVGGRPGKRHARTVRSSELPLVGGVAMIVAIAAATVGVGIFLNFDLGRWELVGIVLGAMGCFGAVGFLDDWRKVRGGQGISERAKLAGVLIVSLAAAVALNRLVLSARFAYAPYSDVPLLGDLLRHTHYAWIAFFLLMTAAVTSTTSLAVDFSDGMDGLTGGLLVSAALSFAIIVLSQTGTVNWPSALVLLAMVGALLGYLPFNWPSSYKAGGQGRGRRRARLIMGDTGALALGGALALVTVITRLELILPFIGGVFVLEGISALISARILVKFFRRFLTLLRFGGERGFAHTEFPLPFLATPMHHHYDLLGWDRQRLVYGAWTLGAGLALLGVGSSIAPFTWERYLTRFVALVLILAVWQLGPWTRSFFIGLVPAGAGAGSQPARLCLYYGFPYRLLGFRLYGRVDTVATTEAALATPAERLSLWQRMSRFDARAVLGSYCFRAGDYEDAARLWQRIPPLNLKFRPEIATMLRDALHQLALEGVVDPGLEDAPAEAPVRDARDVAPATPLADSGWPAQTQPSLRAQRLEPVNPADAADAPDPAAPHAGPSLWNASGWAPPDTGQDHHTLPHAPPQATDAHDRGGRPVDGPRPPYTW